jgi:hypothetical protein
MRRLLAIGAVAGMFFVAFALARRPMAAHAASNAGNLIALPGARYAGCPLGPAYTFCDQPPGTASQAVPFLIQSSAAVTGLSVSLQAIPGLSANFAAADFTISSNGCTGNLAANAQCQIELEFSPTATGLRQAVLAVSDEQGDALAINIEGTGSNLALTSPYGVAPGISDNSFNFGAIPVASASPTESFTITAGNSVTQINVALQAVPGLESEFASGGVDFAETNNCSALAAGASCTVSVEFTPTAVGLRSAALNATDAEGDTTTVYLSGYGSNGRGGNQAGGLGFGFTTTSTCTQANYFVFCNVPAGGISTASIFTVQNTSGTQITGLTIPAGSVFAQGALAPDFTVQNSSCSSVLDANASCQITVAFTPTTSGLRQGAIDVTDTQGDVAAVNLAGVGDDYNIATELPDEISVIPGGTATFNATLTPDNVFGMNGEQVTFSCPTNLPVNTSCAVTPCPAAITPGMPVSVKIVFVTSSATTVAAVPTAGCSSYGPSQIAVLGAPAGERSGPPAAGGSRSSALFPALLVLAVLGAAGLLIGGFAAPGGAGSRKRLPLYLVCAGLAAAVLTGCHHHTPIATTATPTGVTLVTLLGTSIDANGQPLNASRSFHLTLDVAAK